jgi:hypothetical protein
MNTVLDPCPQIRCCLDDAPSENLKKVERMQLGEAVECWFGHGLTRVLVNGDKGLFCSSIDPQATKPSDGRFTPQ